MLMARRVMEGTEANKVKREYEHMASVFLDLIRASAV